MNNLISVIVPVYNVEKYIRKCLESILNQTYTNLEIIIVNDGSTDQSLSICREFADRDSRIILIDKENGGLSSARNSGLDIATGDFIAFVDSDDYLDSCMYEKMIFRMESENLDLVECGVNIDFGSYIESFMSFPFSLLSGKEALKKQLNCWNFNEMPRIAVWSKLYKKDFWQVRRFPIGKVHEDYMLTCEALYLANSIGFINEGLYFHFVNPDSITHQPFSSKTLFLEEQYKNRCHFLRNDSELESLAKIRYYDLVLSLLYSCHVHHMTEERYLTKIIKDNYRDIKRMNLSKKLEFKFFLVRLNASLYCFLQRLYYILRRKGKNG